MNVGDECAAPFLPLANVARRVSLQPLTPQEYDFVYAITTDPSAAFRWRYRAMPPPYESVVHLIRSDEALVQFVVEDKRDRVPIGLASAFAYDFRHACCQLGVIMAPERSGVGAGIEAGLLLLDFVFRVWPLRFVYMEVPAFNFDQVSAGANRLYEEVGRLRQHRFYRGSFVDVVTLRVTRDAWVNSPVIARLRARETLADRENAMSAS